MGSRSIRHRHLSQRLPTNQRAPQREERLVDVGPLVILHAQTAKLIEPGKRPLHDPPPPAQSTPVRGATHGEPRHDMPRPQSAPNRRRVVAAIPEHTVRPAAAAVAPVRRAAGESHRPTPGLLASRSGSRRSGEPRAARPARRKSDGACSRAWPDRWDSDRSGPRPARMEQLSTTARDQSIWSERAGQSRSAKWIRSHTPACCQSRTRRQHVIPDPHPSSCGSICQGMPLRRTKRMPVRHARSETRGRPPFGRQSGAGKNGSTRSHNGSGSSAAAIPIHYFADED
jgi:hypothetical protein